MLDDRIRYQQVAYFRATGKLPPSRIFGRTMPVREFIRAKRSWPNQIEALLDVCANMQLTDDNLIGASDTKTHWRFSFNIPLKPKASRF